MTFLPKGYEVPNSGGFYMKWQQGENKFRILSPAIIGYEYWVTEGKSRKPKRVRMDESIPAEELEVNDQTGYPEKPKHFWAMVVYNYTSSQLEILEITQKGIQKALSQLARDKDWGDPIEYDIVVTRTGEGIETEYSVVPKPAKKLDAAIEKMYKERTIHLEALYDGDDPFDDKKTTIARPTTPQVASEVDEKEINVEDIPF
jgi:hypothetical protein